MDFKVFNKTKQIAALLLFLMVSVSLTMQAQAQNAQNQSDYKIVQSYKKDYASLSQMVEQATSVSEIDSVITQINNLSSTYSSHKQLLDNALYPDTYEAQLQKLQQLAHTTESRLTVMQNQSQKLAQLNQQVADYSSQLKKLNNTTDSLSTLMQKTSSSNARMSRVIREYRESIKKRNDFISSVIDSLFVTYNNLKLPSVKSESGAKTQMGTNGDALKLIQNIAAENSSFLDAHPTLSTDEYVKMYAVQSEFSNMWNKLGDKLLDIFAPGKQQEARKNVENALSQWHSKVSNYTWKAIGATFKEQKIDLGQFNDGKSFNSSLTDYLDEAIKRSREHADDQEYQKFQDFSNLWNNTVKTKWADNLVKANVMTYDNIANVDQKVSTWGQLAQPKSYAMFIYLGIAIVIIIILAFMLYRAKSTPDTGRE
jgi:hypothetical protein